MKSFVSGTSDRPLLYSTIGEALDQTAVEYPDGEALRVCHQDVRWSYSELLDKVEEVAAGLVALGLEPGDRVGIWSPNNAEWLVTQFATAKAGLILVNINPSYRLAELEYSLAHVGCKALVLADSFKTSDYIGMIQELCPELASSSPGDLHSERLPDLRLLIHLGTSGIPGMYRFDTISSMADTSSRSELTARQAALDPDDPINIQFTSGTTGFPKGATLSHFNILNNGYFVAEAMQFSEKDRLCIPVPLYHCFGMVMGVLGCVTHGATMVFPDEGFDPGSVLRSIAEEACTALYGVPTMFVAELEHPDFGATDFSSLRTGVMAGAPCPIEIMRRVMAEMNMSQITICYGMTETSPVSFQSAVDDPVEMRVSTVGRIHPHVQVKIIDTEGSVIPRGESGELCTRGYSVMRGYWGEEERTREVVDDTGWMRTGDLATLDKEGYCTIVGRVTDMIIRGGENIYPREIEEFLHRHEKIQDVAVFGVPDPKYGEQVAAWVQLKEGETASAEEIQGFCEGQIAKFKIPRYVSLVDGLPMTVTGKVQKFIMRKTMARELGLDGK